MGGHTRICISFYRLTFKSKRLELCSENSDVGQLAVPVENKFEAIVEADGRIRIKSPVHLKKGLKMFVSVPDDKPDSAIRGVGISE